MKKGILLALVMILLTSCLSPPAVATLTDAEKISTFVAATRTAEFQSEDQAPPNTETPETSQEDTPQPQDTIEASPTATETPTLTPTPTETPTPTLAAGDPVLSLGVPSFEDSFEDGDNIYLYDEAQSSFQIEDDNLVVTAKKANNYETWTLTWGDLRNFYLEITGEFGEECGGKDRFGMIFRAPDTLEGYLISVSCDGSTRLSSWESEDEEYTTIQEWTSSSYINSGPGGVNRLGIMTKGSTLTGYINGQFVFEVTDSTFDKGRWGVMVAASNTPGFKAVITQAAYWKLP
jgi:hypothetical protein